jgi:hypothetical protein
MEYRVNNSILLANSIVTRCTRWESHTGLQLTIVWNLSDVLGGRMVGRLRFHNVHEKFGLKVGDMIVRTCARLLSRAHVTKNICSKF